jgi:hypothetical protein
MSLKVMIFWGRMALGLTLPALPVHGLGLIITGVCAVTAYAVFCVIGWLCAGFTRDA